VIVSRYARGTKDLRGDGDSHQDQGRALTLQEEPMSQKSRGYFNRPRPEREWDDDSPPALPPKPTLSSSSSSYNTKQYSSKTPAHRSQSNNPFNVDRDVLDFDSRTSEKTQHASHYNDGSRQQRDLLSFDEPERGWYNFSESDSTAAADPWAGRGWGTGNGQGQASPASSTGTRMSKDTIVEDPFRN